MFQLPGQIKIGFDRISFVFTVICFSCQKTNKQINKTTKTNKKQKQNKTKNNNSTTKHTHPHHTHTKNNNNNSNKTKLN